MSTWICSTQEERSLSRSQGGLGIGLTVVRTMVEQHGGTVVARSAGLGAGSEFTVVLPRLDHLVEAVHKDETPQPAFKPARILVVDDNVDANTVMVMFLQLSGYEVEAAIDGPNAISTFMREPSQIVLCDIGLPGMSGYEVAQRIRQCSENHHAPVPLMIALTGYNGETDRAKALSSGFDHHMAKPVDIKNLLKLIANSFASASQA